MRDGKLGQIIVADAIQIEGKKGGGDGSTAHHLNHVERILLVVSFHSKGLSVKVTF
jgi:hypothetical protein